MKDLATGAYFSVTASTYLYHTDTLPLSTEQHVRILPHRHSVEECCLPHLSQLYMIPDADITDHAHPRESQVVN